MVYYLKGMLRSFLLFLFIRIQLFTLRFRIFVIIRLVLN